MPTMDESEEKPIICRLCDQNEDVKHSVFDKSDDGQEIIELINECLPVIVNRTDPLSKQVCESCYKLVNTVYKFKKLTQETANKQNERIGVTENGNDNLEDSECNASEKLNELATTTTKATLTETTETFDIGTSTEDVQILCTNCRTSLKSSLENNELYTEQLNESIINDKIKINSETEKVLRHRRRGQAFYHELDDSLCSSLTEFTNTESYDDYHTDDMESVDTDYGGGGGPKAKRRKLSSNYYNYDCNELETRYYPLSLLTLSLNVINRKNLGDDFDKYSYDFYEKIIQPKCTYCNIKFKNCKLLALHEVKHISIELGDKVDNRSLWHNSRDDADIRNKWLENYDFIDNNSHIDNVNDNDNEDNHDNDNEDNYQNEDNEDNYQNVDNDENNENMIDINDMMDIDIDESDIKDNSFLIHTATDESLINNDDDNNISSDILLENGKPFVNGIPLNEYSKDERKSFYKTMKIDGFNKKFCPLCRYSFKDNWAIEAHYFSLACYFTCRYCGARFNKQRNMFSDHVTEHEERGETLSTQIYTASKNNSIYPKIIDPNKITEMVQINDYYDKQKPQIKIKNLPQQKHPQFQPLSIKIKEEPCDSPTSPQTLPPPLPPQRPPSSSSSSLQTLPPPPPRSSPNKSPNKSNSKNKDSDQAQIKIGGSKSNNQAYFCRKCYKVFFKLDEFNVHSKNCDFNQFPQVRNNTSRSKPNKQQSQNNTTRQTSRSSNNNNNKSFETNNSNSNGDVLVSPSGRPMRNCVKDIGPYKDEPEIKDQPVNAPSPNVICFKCNTAFRTVYSRNSHMRIHKGETSVPLSTSNKKNSIHSRKSSSSSLPVVKNEIKREPLEPEIQIHESEQTLQQSSNRRSSLGAVSITLISKNPNQKAKINPSIMKLVQNNPHLTIKTNTMIDSSLIDNNRYSSQSASNVQNSSNSSCSSDSENKSYKCSNCWETFTNKSHLYFHKKNQCEGSKFPCPFCKKRFGTESAYSSHIFYSHPE